MKFKVGDEIEAISEYYGLTNKSDEWRGIITYIHYNGNINCITTHHVISSIVGDEFTELDPEDFILYDKLRHFKQFLKTLEGGSDV